MDSYKSGLGQALADLNEATQWLAKNGISNPDNAGAAAVPYLKLFALVAMGHMWANIAVTAQQCLEKDKADEEYYRNKLITAAYFYSHIIIETSMLKQRVQAGAANLMALSNEAFVS